MTRVGLMLYTVRDECSRDLAGTLRAVAEMGYEGVELFDLHGHAPEQVRAWLDDLGLEACGRHASLQALENDLAELAAQAPVIGTNRLALSWIEAPTSREDARAFAARFGRLAGEVAALGLELGFHNHDGEVRELDGRALLDDLLELPVFLELDLGWIWWAGVDPVAVLERTRGRVPLVHVKDFRTRGERSFCPVGAGNVGYERVAPAAVDAGVEWLVVEQDETDGSSLAAARQSLDALSSMLVTA